MKALLFDFDGVLVQSMEDHYEGWRRALTKYQIKMSEEELYLMEGQGVKGVAREISRKFRLPLTDTTELIKEKQEYYNQIKKIRFYPNLIDTLNWGKEKALKMGVVTGGNRSRVVEALESFDLLYYFQCIITSDDVGETKPSPEPYLTAASELQVDPESCVVIENAPLGIRSGKSAGMKVIGITTTLQPYHLKEADVVVNDFKELLAVLKKIF